MRASKQPTLCHKPSEENCTVFIVIASNIGSKNIGLIALVENTMLKSLGLACLANQFIILSQSKRTLDASQPQRAYKAVSCSSSCRTQLGCFFFLLFLRGEKTMFKSEMQTLINKFGPLLF